MFGFNGRLGESLAGREIQTLGCDCIVRILETGCGHKRNDAKLYNRRLGQPVLKVIGSSE